MWLSWKQAFSLRSDFLELVVYMQALTLLQEVYGMTQCSELGLSSGTEGLWREGVKMTPGAGSLPQARSRKMSSWSARRCMEIAAWLLEGLQMSWTWTAIRCGRSSRKTWRWGRSVQKWFRSCWKRSGKSGECRCVMTYWNNSKPKRTFRRE